MTNYTLRHKRRGTSGVCHEVILYKYLRPLTNWPVHVWLAVMQEYISMVKQSKGCLMTFSIVFFMVGISYLLTTDQTQYLNNAIGTFYLSRTGISIFNSSNGSEVKHSTRYANSSKRFVLHAIDSLNISIKTITSTKEVFREGRSDAKVMLELL